MKLGLPDSSAARQAVLIAALMMAWQVAAKGTRDSLFLAAFTPANLPAANVVAAVCSILLAIAAAQLLRRIGPGRVIPAAYLLGTLLHAAEWALLPAYPRAIAAFIYVHIIALGPVLLSGFWALANERFDPREARRRFGQITAFGTIGAVAGPLIAERVALLSSPNSLLLFLAALQLACFAALLGFAPARHNEPAPESTSLPDIISGAPYLLRLAAFVLLIAMSAATLDYVFKVQVNAQFKTGPQLTRFFLLFNAATAAVTFAAQAALSRAWLKRFGPGQTVAVLPAAVTGASLLSLLFPGPLLILSRAIEQLLRGSLYRTGYELFFTPMPPAEKRSTKPAIDIGADRSGDLLANAGIQLLLLLPPGVAPRVILGLTASFAAAAAWLAFRLDKAYVTVLEKGLVRHTVVMQPEEAEDAVTRSIVLKTLPALSLAGREGHGPAHQPLTDKVLLRLAELRSGDPLRVRAALQTRDPLDPLHLAQLIDLLGRDPVARLAHDALGKAADRASGLLVDRLADASADPKIRRRIPRILARAKNRIAWEGLLAQTDDERFEIRLRCARALEKMHGHCTFTPDAERIFEIAGRELDRATRPLPKPLEVSEAPGDDELLAVGEVLRERAAQRMTLIATLLGLVLPPQPVHLAFRALHTSDPKLRGVALEYLDSALPQALRTKLSKQFEGPRPEPRAAGPRSEEALANLIDSSPSIIAKIEELGRDTERRERSGPVGGPPGTET